MRVWKFGDSVNTASRVEGLNKYFGTRIAVTAAAAAANPGTPFRPLGSIVLKGKTEPIDILEPLSPERAAAPATAGYHAAYAALSAGDPAARTQMRRPFTVSSSSSMSNGVPCKSAARIAACSTGTDAGA